MYEKIVGRVAKAIVFADNIEESALVNLQEMCDKKWLQNSKIRIMPDVHSGKGCVIGTTLTIENSAVDPRFVGVDLGCGVSAYPLKTKFHDIDYRSLDNFIRDNIPHGINVNKVNNPLYRCASLLSKLKCVCNVDVERAGLSLGTLGGGELVATISVNSR